LLDIIELVKKIALNAVVSCQIYLVRQTIILHNRCKHTKNLLFNHQFSKKSVIFN